MQILRIQDAAGWGIYYRDDDPFSLYNVIEHHEAHPSPRCDEGIGADWMDDEFCSSMRFGFLDIDQLRRWVYSEEARVALDEAGFSIVVLSIEPEYVRVGLTQVIYQPRFVTNTRTVSIVGAEFEQLCRGEI